jgi:hypothetical protein
VAVQLIEAQGTSLAENARMFALLNMAICDNPRTAPDPAFTPFITTPSYPSYPSGAGSLSNAARHVLEGIFGNGRHSITLSNPALPGVTLRYTRLRQITDDIADARVYGGIHFRFEQDEAEVLGRRAGRFVQKHYLRCARAGGCDDSDDDDDNDGDERLHAFPSAWSSTPVAEPQEPASRCHRAGR